MPRSIRYTVATITSHNPNKKYKTKLQNHIRGIVCVARTRQKHLESTLCGSAFDSCVTIKSIFKHRWFNILRNRIDMKPPNYIYAQHNVQCTSSRDDYVPCGQRPNGGEASIRCYIKSSILQKRTRRHTTATKWKCDEELLVYTFRFGWFFFSSSCIWMWIFHSPTLERTRAVARNKNVENIGLCSVFCIAFSPVHK